MALLLEFASLLVKRSSSCCLLHGPFAIRPTMALSKVLINCWGTRLTYVVQKEHVVEVIRGVEAHKVDVTFLYFVVGREGSVPGGRDGGQRD